MFVKREVTYNGDEENTSIDYVIMYSMFPYVLSYSYVYSIMLFEIGAYYILINQVFSTSR